MGFNNPALEQIVPRYPESRDIIVYCYILLSVLKAVYF